MKRTDKLNRLEVIDKFCMVRCLACGAIYSPNIQPGGKLPRRWYVCPLCGNNGKEKKKS